VLRLYSCLRRGLDAIGYVELQPQLDRLSKADRWVETERDIEYTGLDKIAVVGEPSEIASKLALHYANIFGICAACVFGGDAHNAGP
jgi:hypothetical protein